MDNGFFLNAFDKFPRKFYNQRKQKLLYLNVNNSYPAQDVPQNIKLGINYHHIVNFHNFTPHFGTVIIFTYSLHLTLNSDQNNQITPFTRYSYFDAIITI